MSEKETTAFARLKEYPTNRVWVVDKCPHCKRQHVHGAGGLEHNPKDFLSHRVAHCIDTNNDGYILKERR